MEIPAPKEFVSTKP